MKTISASKVGFPCIRHLWYCVNEYDAGETDQKTQRIFDVGTYLEPMVVEWLQDDGWIVDYNPGSQEAELELKIPLVGGDLIGHPDCFMSKPEFNENVLADIKTMNDRAFRQWKKEGSLKSKPQYVDQLHVYAMGAIQAGYKVDKLAIVGLNKNNSDLHIDFFDYDWLRAESICERAESVFNAIESPTENCPSESWCCRYCGYSPICELNNLERNTEVGEEIQSTNDAEVIGAIEQLQEAKEQSQVYKKLSDEAKAMIDEKVRSKGISTLQAGKLLLKISQRTSTKFDEKAFKAANPDLAKKYVKQTASLYYDIYAN